MISRYARKEMTFLWSIENKYQKWLDIEILVCEALADRGEIPKSAIESIRSKAHFDVGKIDEIEKTTKHDVIAFLTDVASRIGDDGRFLHMGLTSSDILDTSLALLMRDAADILLADIDQLLDVIRNKAFEHKHTLMIGRSHGIHAEPITFGLKMGIWYQEMLRNKNRLISARETISTGKISGAVGTFSFIHPFVEEYVCRALGLKPAPVSSQIVQRDRHAEYFSVLAIIASSLDKFSQEIRLLQRTEVREAEEYFSPGQKGSSAMPHKRNPVLSENISGLSRLMRSYALAALEDVALWHERDISHSSVERIIAPDATILMDFMLYRFTGLVKNLVVYPERMMTNVHMTHGIIFSQMVLLKLVEKGVSRDEAYAMVQKNAMAAWEKEQNFRDVLCEDKVMLMYMSTDEIAAIFRYENFLTHLDFIFERTFGGIA